MDETLSCETVDLVDTVEVIETLAVAEERKAGRPEGEIQGRLFDLLRANRIGIAKSENLANEIAANFCGI